MSPGPVDQTSVVRTLERGLGLLECFDVSHPAWTLADLSRAVGLHKATTRRLVKTLEARRFLALDASTGQYRLGPTLLPMSYVVRSNDQLVRIARPFVRDLARRTEESVGLWIWTDAGMLQIDREITTHPFKPEMLPGTVSREYGTAFSKLFLAFGPEDRLSSLSWEGHGQLTVADATAVREELDRVREAGLAFDQRTTGVCAVGAPVMDSAGDLAAVITVVAPPERFGPTQRETIAALAKETAEALSRELGFRDARAGTVVA